jgi:hypothetical protein
MGAAIQTYSYKTVTPLYGGDEALKRAVALKPSTTFAAGTLLGEITASPGVFAAYASGNSDGTQNPNRILPYDCITDAAGNITRGSGGIVAGGGQYGITDPTADVYVSGVFAIADIPNQDAAGLAKAGRVIGNGEFVLTGP